MKYGMKKEEFEDLINNGDNSNANLAFSPEMVVQYTYEAVAKEYNLSIMPKQCRKAYLDGFVHHHDLHGAILKPNCLNHNIRFYAKNGLKIDGKGESGAVAKPAKSLEVLLNHMLQAFMAGACVLTGGQAFTNFNTFLAPFAKGRSYREIKQAIQGFIFNCNMSLVARGGQVLFSSIGLDLSMPDVLKDVPAVCPGNVIIGTYKDYMNEFDLIFRAVCEVLDEKDGQGAYFRFPNTLFSIREGDLDEYSGNCKLLHELGANNPTIYYVNCTNAERTVMGCRTANELNYTGDYFRDCLGAGNFMYGTLNLPLIALTYKEDFFKYLDKYVEIIYDTLKWRRKQVSNTIYNKHMSDFLLWEDDEDKLYNFDTSSMTIGVCGLYECVKQLEKIDGFVENIDDFYDDGLGVRIMKFINKKVEEFKERDGLRWGCIGSPAESTAYKFGKINVEKFPEEAIVQGTKDTPYLTNSTHIPVNRESNIIDHIRNADTYHPLTRAGNILHLWLGEVWSDPESLWRLNQKITGTGTQFWAYSKVFTYCQQCGYTINDNLDECPICKSKDLRVYDRCFSGDTKIFVRKDNIIKPVDLKDFVENYDYKSWQVPVFDSKTQSYVWCNVKRVIKNPAEPMVKIGFNKGYNVTCTPSHDFFKYSNTRKSMYETIKADDLHIKDRIMNHSCPVFFDEGNENVLGTFIGFVLGDGSFTNNNKDSLNIYIRIKVYEPEKRDYLKWLLEANNLDYSLHEGLDERWNSKTYSFGIGANNVGNPAYDIFNKYSNKRDIIKECYDTDLMLGVFAGLINSDGSVLIGRKNQVITTFNQVDRDILYCFYWIAMLLGVNPSLSFTEREGYESVGRIEMSSIKMWDLLHKIHLREPFKTNVGNGMCRADAKRVNGMCSVKSIEEAPMQESYCIEVGHEDHNTLFNGVLAQNCTGYYLPIKTWNKGKKAEFKDRYRHMNI